MSRHHMLAYSRRPRIAHVLFRLDSLDYWHIAARNLGSRKIIADDTETLIVKFLDTFDRPHEPRIDVKEIRSRSGHLIIFAAPLPLL